MTTVEWNTCTDPMRMLSFLQAHPVGTVDDPYPGAGPSHWPSERKLRLFACACSRSVWHLLADERSRRAVETAELFADGLATEEERKAALEEGSTAAIRSTSRQYGLKDVARVCCFSNQHIAGHVGHWKDFDSVLPLATQANLLRDVAGNPFAPVTFNHRCPTCYGNGKVHVPEPPYVRVMIPRTKLCRHCHGKKVVDWRWTIPWLTPLVQGLAHAAYTERLPTGFLDPDHLAVLADALEDSGCDNLALLAHLRGVQENLECADCCGRGWNESGLLGRGSKDCSSCHGMGWVKPSEPLVHCRGCWAVDLLTGRE